jgi:hypothetical protein
MSRKNTTYGAFSSNRGQNGRSESPNGKISDDLFRRIS